MMFYRGEKRRYIFTMIDSCTRFGKAVEINDQSGLTCLNSIPGFHNLDCPNVIRQRDELRERSLSRPQIYKLHEGALSNSSASGSVDLDGKTNQQKLKPEEVAALQGLF
eukprot:GHVP01011333.1.p1 GENE.GHVP01011333.1~~GHVP01011333.1.p1  ORF type:complete len:109 (+),score=10.57 GHVP01011333.1:78-404(+)